VRLGSACGALPPTVHVASAPHPLGPDTAPPPSLPSAAYIIAAQPYYFILPLKIYCKSTKKCPHLHFFCIFAVIKQQKTKLKTTFNKFNYISL
jgi:hypothetical protein